MNFKFLLTRKSLDIFFRGVFSFCINVLPLTTDSPRGDSGQSVSIYYCFTSTTPKNAAAIKQKNASQWTTYIANWFSSFCFFSFAFLSTGENHIFTTLVIFIDLPCFFWRLLQRRHIAKWFTTFGRGVLAVSFLLLISFFQLARAFCSVFLYFVSSMRIHTRKCMYTRTRMKQ